MIAIIKNELLIITEPTSLVFSYLKIALKLAPFGPSETLGEALQVSIEARRLDVAASPYDASGYGLEPIRIETPEGRIAYREAQLTLMEASAPVRSALASQFSTLLELYWKDGGDVLVSGAGQSARGESPDALPRL